jgi:two-component system alkaline phosphatase synthesis response regulator PhoP
MDYRHGGNVRILIVDDDEDMRRVIRTTLEPLTHDIHEASNAIDALTLARAERPDLVILDVMMPGVDGYEICYLIKTSPELHHTRVIILTVRHQKIDISISRGAFADAFLVKPFDPGKLLAAIGRLERGERGPFPATKLSDEIPNKD